MKHTLLALSLLVPSAAHAVSFDSKNLKCLAENIYHEARGESTEGMVAVGIVTINRVKHSKFKNSICKVVYEPKQFSWTRNSRVRNAAKNKQAWAESKRIAINISKNKYPRWAKKYSKSYFFHSGSSKTRWGKPLIARTGNHVFY